MDELYRQEWPGNIRQLRNTVFRTMVLAHGPDVQRRDVIAALAGGVVSVPAALAAAPSAPADGAAASPASGDSIAPAVPPAVAPTAAPVGGPRPATAADERNESVVEIPRPSNARAERSESAAVGSEAPAVGSSMASLPPRLIGLLRQVVAAGTYSTQAHMAASGLSHRTALRDMQALLGAGALERVGSRRGAFYRPSPAAGRFLAGLAESASGLPTEVGELGQNKNPSP
jgi:hypothetical protein